MTTKKFDYSKINTIIRKGLKKIFSPVYNTETRTYERRHNADVQNFYWRSKTRSYSKSRKIEIFGHVWRADGK